MSNDEHTRDNISWGKEETKKKLDWYENHTWFAN